jgi:hypothetical protein
MSGASCARQRLSWPASGLAVHDFCPGAETFGSETAVHQLHHSRGEVGRENLSPAPSCLNSHHTGAGRDISQAKPGRAARQTPASPAW